MLKHALIAGFGLADIFAQAGALLFGHRRDAGADAAQGGGDVVDVIHEADQSSSCGHEGSLRFPDASADLTAAARATIHCSTCGPIWQRRTALKWAYWQSTYPMERRASCPSVRAGTPGSSLAALAEPMEAPESGAVPPRKQSSKHLLHRIGWSGLRSTQAAHSSLAGRRHRRGNRPLTPPRPGRFVS